MCQHHPIAISQLSSWWFGFLNMFVSFLPHATLYLHVTPNLLFGLSSGDFVYLNIITHHEDKLELLVAWIVSTTPNQEPTDQARSLQGGHTKSSPFLSTQIECSKQCHRNQHGQNIAKNKDMLLFYTRE